MKVALAHDSLTQFGGAERVLQALHEIYPDAPIYTLVYDPKVREHFEGWTIISSPLQHLYNLFPKFQAMLPLIPAALRFFNFSQYDLVISSSSVFMKGIHVPKKTMHINYCHTPARFLWFETKQYVHDEVPKWLRLPVLLYLRWMRHWDYKAAQRVTHFIANSENVQKRIRKYYNRGSTVIYPYVDVNFFYPSAPKENHYLVAGRLHAHKNLDLVIEAFNQTGRLLHVVGTGRDKARLQKKAHENILFLGKVSDTQLRDEYSAAKGYIYPQEEDFGLMPLEANACGTAVIAYGKGGALETILPGKTGVLFTDKTIAGLQQAIQKFENTVFENEQLFERAEQFSKEKFKERILAFVKLYCK